MSDSRVRVQTQSVACGNCRWPSKASDRSMQWPECGSNLAGLFDPVPTLLRTRPSRGKTVRDDRAKSAAPFAFGLEREEKKERTVSRAPNAACIPAARPGPNGARRRPGRWASPISPMWSSSVVERAASRSVRGCGAWACRPSSSRGTPGPWAAAASATEAYACARPRTTSASGSRCTRR